MKARGFDWKNEGGKPNAQPISFHPGVCNANAVACLLNQAAAISKFMMI